MSTSTFIPVRFAILGCGRIAKNHVAPLKDIDGMQLVAVCDLQRERADAAGRSADVAAYTNYHEMLLREQIDVVCILTPSGMHPAHAIDIMERYQKHVVIEKPMA